MLLIEGKRKLKKPCKLTKSPKFGIIRSGLINKKRGKICRIKIKRNLENFYQKIEK